MKVTLALLASLAATCLAAPQQQAYNYQQPQAQAQPQPQQGYTYQQPAAAAYSFGYNVDAYDPVGQPVQYGHTEERQGVRTTGTYFVLLPDTRRMTVNYYVDETGFHPTYTFEGQAQYPQQQTYQQPQGYQQPQQQGFAF